MAGRKNLTDLGVANLKPRASRYAHPDPQLSGHFIRVTPTGSKSYCAVANDPLTGKQVWATIGRCDLIGIAEARQKAQEAIKRVRAGKAPFEPPAPRADTFRAVAEVYMKRHVEGQGLRSRYEIERILNVYVLPKWGSKEFRALRRSDVVELLDGIEDDRGKRQADYVLAVIRGLCNWYAARNDDYQSPIARGMRRTDPKTRKRARILDDDEIRAVWKHAETQGAYGALIRLLLLTAQRRDKVAAMKHGDIVDSEWRVPAEEREKGTGGALMLPAVALEIINSVPRMARNPYVFAGRERTHFSGFSKSKVAFDKGLPDMPPWVLHDLRRTAKSLMARAGVRPDISERVLGHVISGVEGVYDRHSYRDEKADALQKLAALIDAIVNPRTDNIVQIRSGRDLG